MTREEFGKLSSIIEAFWPGKFNEHKLQLLWDRCAERCTYVEMGTAIKDRMLISAPTDIAEIIAATGEIINSEARKRIFENKRPERICSQCENTGWVQATDDKDYAYAFRCHCPAAQAKGISAKIPIWEEKYKEMGYKRMIYKKASECDRAEALRMLDRLSGRVRN